jgi:hypothetical protein
MTGFTWRVAVSRYDKKAPDLYRTFATTKPTEAGVLAFANEYGLLKTWHVDPAGPLPLPGVLVGGDLAYWKDQIGQMKAALNLWDQLRQGEKGEEGAEELRRRINGQLLDNTAAQMVPDTKKGGMILQTWPTSLVGVMWLQLASVVTANEGQRTCAAHLQRKDTK